MSYDLVTGTDPSFFKINRQRGLLIRTNASIYTTAPRHLPSLSVDSCWVRGGVGVHLFKY